MTGSVSSAPAAPPPLDPPQPAPGRRGALGLTHPRHTWAASAALAAYYLASMSRDMSCYDSPELALVAIQGGVGHPIGQPLHTLVGHVLVQLGALVGAPALWCLNALSALACALTLVPVVSVLDRLAPPLQPPNATAAAKPAVAGAGWLRPWLVAFMGLHASLWEPATRIEVYPLGTLLGAASVACLVAAMGDRSAPGALSGTARRRCMALAGLLLALCSGANAVSATFFAVAMAPSVAYALWTRRVRPAQILPAIAAAVLGMLVWVYVPLAARDPDVVAWGRPDSWPALRLYLTGADYSGKSVALLSAGFVDHLAAFAVWSNRVGLAPLLALGFLGLAARARALLPLAALLFFANAGWYARYDPFAPGVLDYLGYLGAPLWFLAGGCALVAEWASQRGHVAHALSVAALVALVALSSPALGERTRAEDHFTRDLPLAALAELPPNATLVVEADHWAAPLMYLQEVEARRPDVVVIPLGLASSSWLWELVYRRHPDLAPFVVRAPGGRDARVARFLAAQPARRAFTNTPDIAARLRAPSCVSGLLLALSPCVGEPARDSLEPLLRQAHASLAGGAPGTVGLIAWEAENRARALAQEGRAREAFHMLTFTVAGVEERLLPMSVPPFVLPVDAPAPDDSLGSWRRNLTLAASLAQRAQQPALAQRLHQLAARAAP